MREGSGFSLRFSLFESAVGAMGDKGAWLTSSADRNAEPNTEQEARKEDRGTGCLEVDDMGASSPATITSTIDDYLDDDGGADPNAEFNTELEARE